MKPAVRYVENRDYSPVMFSVCSLVRDVEKYDRLLASFARLGFTSDNTEFLAADNRDANRFDGYTWHKTLLAEARGSFVIFCHDDIELIDDGYAELVACIAWLDEHDPRWLLAGVAGGVWRTQGGKKNQRALHITDLKGNDRRLGTLPSRVETLDECFMMMRRTKPVISSYDLGGFHHYGPDLCLQAELLGGSAYAVDFHIQHHGMGTKGPDFRQSRKRFSKKFRAYFGPRVLNCTTGAFPLSKETSEPDSDEGEEASEA